jgi:PfaD family protein
MTQALKFLEPRSNARPRLSLPLKVDVSDKVVDEQELKMRLKDLNSPLFFSGEGDALGASTGLAKKSGEDLIAYVDALPFTALGDDAFKKAHNTEYAYYAGAMANGIASEELVIALGKAGFLCSFGAAGLVKSRVEEAIKTIQKELPNGPYAFNLIHSPNESALEKGNVDLFLQYGVKTVEASAYMALTEHIVHYRVAGLAKGENGEIIKNNRVIAKVSRMEVATRFMQPAPEKMLDKLLGLGLITAEQKELAATVPMSDDVTVEADSGGHTDNRPLVSVLPSIIALRDQIQTQYNYDEQIRVGVGGGIGTANAALGAFMMGAAYIVTGSINQACYQADASEHTRKILAQADMADVIMAPAADMFEQGVKLQVLKRGTLFAMRAQKLYELYMAYDSIEAIPADERAKIEKQIFRQNLDEIWTGTIDFFQERDPTVIEKAQNNPKRKMALIFRWYLGLSSRWSNIGEKGREMDYQIWAGPALGAFNVWVKGTYLENFENRDAVKVAKHILEGAAYLYRIQQLEMQGLRLSPELQHYIPS